jgi:hypothetical protein
LYTFAGGVRINLLTVCSASIENGLNCAFIGMLRDPQAAASARRDPTTLRWRVASPAPRAAN